MSPEAQRLADECKRLVVRYGTTWMRCDRDALEYAIDQLASMIPAGGLAEEARDAARYRWLAEKPGYIRPHLNGQAVYVNWSGTRQQLDEAIDAALSAPTPQQEQPR